MLKELDNITYKEFSELLDEKRKKFYKNNFSGNDLYADICKTVNKIFIQFCFVYIKFVFLKDFLVALRKNKILWNHYDSNQKQNLRCFIFRLKVLCMFIDTLLVPIVGGLTK